MSHVLLEKTDHLSDTIFRYQRGKHIMATPSQLVLRSDVEFAAGKREVILDGWNKRARDAQINLRILLAAEHDHGGRLLAALVAAHRLTGLERQDHALGQFLGRSRAEGALHFGQYVGPGQHVALNGIAVAEEVTAPGRTVGAGEAGRAAGGVHQADLPHGAGSIHGDIDSLQNQGTRQHVGGIVQRQVLSCGVDCRRSGDAELARVRDCSPC